MIALNASFVEDLSSMGTFPIIKNLDTSWVLGLWLGIALSFTCIVKYVVFKSHEKLHPLSSSLWKHNSISIVHRCCPKRRARFLKCMKRCERRKAQKKPTAATQEGSWSCPYDCSFARIHMPAPLPFRRKTKKRPSAVRAEPAPTPVEDGRAVEPCNEAREEREFKVVAHEDIDQLPDLSTSSDESQTSKESSQRSSSSRKSKRRRRKRRASISSSAGSSTTTTILANTPSLPVSPTTLIDLALMQNWPQLLVNVKANRRQARERDADGLYALHWAVSGAPPLEVVRALVRAYPGATKKVDSEGSNALCFASHYGGSAEMMELLLRTNPKAISVQDKYGRSPLYHAVDKLASIDVLSVLARADPSMITTACRPMNYLALEKEGKSWKYLTPLFLAWVKFLTDKRSVETCDGKVWDKACLLLDLAYRHQHQLSDDVEVPVVVAAVALDAMLPEELAAVIIQGASPEELLKVDLVSGKNALCLAASMRQLSPSRADELIQLSLDACPGAATVLDREGKTALANAAESGKSWDGGLARLVRTSPDALGWSDQTTGLTPSLLLASSSPQVVAEDDRSAVILADPYCLIGVKSMLLKRRSLEQRRKERSTTCSSATLSSESERGNQHLSSLFQLIREDPSWIVTA